MPNLEDSEWGLPMLPLPIGVGAVIQESRSLPGSGPSGCPFLYNTHLPGVCRSREHQYRMCCRHEHSHPGRACGPTAHCLPSELYRTGVPTPSVLFKRTTIQNKHLSLANILFDSLSIKECQQMLPQIQGPSPLLHGDSHGGRVEGEAQALSPSSPR